MIRIAYHTLGCKVNQYESEMIRESLERAGFATVPFNSPAEVYIINTCSVTGVADSKSRAAVRRALKLNPDAFVVVSGCYAELEPAQIAEIEGVGLVVPNDEKDAIPERIIARFAVNHSEQQTTRPRMRTRAVVKVQDGCDQFCSYCVIPYARSGKASRPIDDVIAELKSLADFGYKEVVLAGIRLGSYQNEDYKLPELIKEASLIEGIERIRLSSIEPWEVDDALLDAMDSPKVCRHLHIPLQSGDDDTLRRMNRPYDTVQYRSIIDKVRGRIPGIGITTDVIVGFPSETDEAFENTSKMIQDIDFSRLHVFRYSARKRTKACDLPDPVDANIKKTRAERLTELGILGMKRFASSLIGDTLDVLVETATPNDLKGFADNYVEVTFPGDLSLRGQVVRVRINGINEDGGAFGEVTD